MAILSRRLPRLSVDLPQEIGLRLLGRMIAHVGQQGGAELGQLEALYSELQTKGPNIRTDWKFSPVRRNVAGALVTLSCDQAHRGTRAAPPDCTQTTEIPAQSSVYHRRLE